MNRSSATLSRPIPHPQGLAAFLRSDDAAMLALTALMLERTRIKSAGLQRNLECDRLVLSGSFK